MLRKEEVAARLDPLHDVFVKAHLDAADRLKRIAKAEPLAIAALNAIERANFFHGQVRSLLAVAIEGIDRVQMTEWDVDTVAVGGDLLVRLKYLGRGAPANVETDQQRLLKGQRYTEDAMATLALAGIMEPPTTVTCGYTLDGPDIARVLIRRDCTGHDPWQYEIYGGATVHEPALLPGIEEAKPAVVRSARGRPAASEGASQG